MSVTHEEMQPVASHTQHPDDAAVDAFAFAMKAKLAQKRAEGRGGWDDRDQCSDQTLSDMLHKHVGKGDPLDVGNFAMMLWHRDSPVLAQTVVEIEPTPEETLVAAILEELTRARRKFPGDNATLAALMEEVGELAKALMEETVENIHKEATQVAVMAMRMVLDGDATFDQWRRVKGLDPLNPKDHIMAQALAHISQCAANNFSLTLTKDQVQALASMLAAKGAGA